MQELGISGSALNEAFAGKAGVKPWDPIADMPSLPEVGTNGTSLNQDYSRSSSAWYLSQEQSLSESLIEMSPAYWDSIYLENEKNLVPVILDPPPCEKWQSDIKNALVNFLADVKNMTNYGSAMTTASMSLVPVRASQNIDLYLGPSRSFLMFDCMHYLDLGRHLDRSCHCFGYSTS